MPTRRRSPAVTGPAKAGHYVESPVTPQPSLAEQVESALMWLKRHSTKANRDGMARYAIPSDHAYGVAMKDIKALGKTLGRNQPLAVALWATGVYEARMLASSAIRSGSPRPGWTGGAGTSTTGPSAMR